MINIFLTASKPILHNYSRFPIPDSPFPMSQARCLCHTTIPYVTGKMPVPHNCLCYGITP
ncbi:MAG: hypothetical protein F6K49_27180 [Moorea sp. SIO3I6]|nr:hypothetical protein [Moorena sp. SIO3I6]